MRIIGFLMYQFVRVTKSRQARDNIGERSHSDDSCAASTASRAIFISIPGDRSAGRYYPRHADHALGFRTYLTSHDGRHVCKHAWGSCGSDRNCRLWRDDRIARRQSFAPSRRPYSRFIAIRVEYAGEVWVVSGDYKVAPDITCRRFRASPVPHVHHGMHVWITDLSLAARSRNFADVNAWWRKNQTTGVASSIFAYALGKAQRVHRRLRRIGRADLLTARSSA